jgi:hypothetical protein
MSVSRIRWTAAGLALLTCLGGGATSPPLEQERPSFKRVAPKVLWGDGWAIAAPADWNAVPGLAKPLVLHLRGDGRTGIPLTDGTLAPVMIGLLVEVYDKDGLPLKKRVETHLNELKTVPRFKTRREPTVEEIQLGDGTRALLTSAEFDRLDNRRLSFHFRAYCLAADGRRVEAIGFLTCNPAGGGFVKGTGLNAFLEAHVRSLVLDPRKLDHERLKKVYAAHPWGVNAALAKTREGNALLDKKKDAAAATAYQEALALCEEVSAAHNGLAWVLITAEDA